MKLLHKLESLDLVNFLLVSKENILVYFGDLGLLA